VCGYLTSATQLEPGATYRRPSSSELHADAEIAVQLRDEVDADGDVMAAIASYAPAIELVDLAGPDDPEAIVAGNLWHRAFALGPRSPTLPTELEASLVVGGETRAHARADPDLNARLRAVARLLAAAGERLQPGDWVLTGNVVQVPLAPGGGAVADFGTLGRVGIVIA
jgi:2-keto-4-pentenoate hydratase